MKRERKQHRHIKRNILFAQQGAYETVSAEGIKRVSYLFLCLCATPVYADPWNKS